MKLFIVIGIFLSINVSGSLSSPIEQSKVYRWNLIPDDEDNKYLIDTKPLLTDAEPFFNAETDTIFWLFTRINPTVGQRITWTAASIGASSFNPNNPVRVLIHGFNSGPNSSMNIGPTAAYLQRGDFNVIVVDWSSGASTMNYVTARNRVPEVANQVARFLDFLVRNGSTQMSRVYIAGHSLGAHVSGLTGKRVTQGRIQVIFGLDPAGPLFTVNAPNERFAAEDAVYTEGIRTNGGGMGYAEPLARADFYPNWGSRQPGCGVDTTGQCSHSRAHHLFAETINSNRFVSRRCLNYQEILNQSCTGFGTVPMGGEPGNVAFNLSGIFFLETNSFSPFARG